MSLIDFGTSDRMCCLCGATVCVWGASGLGLGSLGCIWGVFVAALGRVHVILEQKDSRATQRLPKGTLDAFLFL